ncbi:MAG: hypothetical protein IFJ96_00675 [Acidobacteria bacterium]|nr:hypothetical protein [Candidatus Sulfomarinibacter sp. MAG AM2]
MNNDRLITTSWDEENPVVGGGDPPDPGHPSPCGLLDTVRRRQSATPVRFAHETFQERRNDHLNYTGKSTVGIDGMPVAANPHTTSWLHSPDLDDDRGGQLELDLNLADTRPHVDSIAYRLEIEPERRLADEFAQRVDRSGRQTRGDVHPHLLHPPLGQDQQHHRHHRQEDESTSGSVSGNRRP